MSLFSKISKNREELNRLETKLKEYDSQIDKYIESQKKWDSNYKLTLKEKYIFTLFIMFNWYKIDSSVLYGIDLKRVENTENSYSTGNIDRLHQRNDSMYERYYGSTSLFITNNIKEIFIYLLKHNSHLFWKQEVNEGHTVLSCVDWCKNAIDTYTTEQMYDLLSLKYDIYSNESILFDEEYVVFISKDKIYDKYDNIIKIDLNN
jgi:hypothetical protein